MVLPHTLYLCYFGLREPLVQTQVLPYLRQLVSSGVKVSLLTFEPSLHQRWTKKELSDQQAGLAAEGINWFYRKYHKRPSVLATSYDILAGALAAAQLTRQRGINVLHARSHVPMAMALLAQRLVDCRLIFDIRGLMAEEYADAGIWKEGSLIFRAIKKLEQVGVRRADQIVVLTQRMRDWLVEKKLAAAEKIEVIPCCVDFTRYDGEDMTNLATDRFEIVYAGSVTGLYLLEEIGRFFLEFKRERPDSFLRILTASSPSDTSALLQRIGLSSDDFWVGAAKPSEIPAYFRRARLGLSFRKPTFSQIAASPTKIPEYLAAGMPVICNAGVGDTDELVESERVGVVIKEFAQSAYREAVARLLILLDDVELHERCVRVAHHNFDLARIGGPSYFSVYRRISKLV